MQGEFVSVSRLEADFSGASALIHQIYIYINSLRAYPLAVVVPCRGTLCFDSPAHCPQQYMELLWYTDCTLILQTEAR